MEQALGGMSRPVGSASLQIAKNLGNPEKHLSELEAKIENCSVSDLPMLQEDIESASAGVFQQTEEQVDAHEFNNSKWKKSSKAYFHNRHQITKIQGYLTTHSVPKQLAHVLAANIFNVSISATEEEQDRLFQMGAEGSVKNTLFTSPSGYRCGTSAVRFCGSCCIVQPLLGTWLLASKLLQSRTVLTEWDTRQDGRRCPIRLRRVRHLCQSLTVRWWCLSAG